MTPSRLIAFLAALVLSLAGGSDAAAKSARREILAALESASSEWARASAERVREKLASEAKPASGPRDYPYAQVVEEYTSTNGGAKQLAATFTFADDLISQTRYTGSAGALTATTQFIQSDGFGSTRWLTNAAGAITDKVDYDAFGNEVDRTGTTAIEHLYRGEAFDPSVGFYYLRARWMQPSSGRFLTQDVFPGFSMDPRSLHRYAYASSDAVNNIDPMGLYTMADVTAANTVQDILTIIRGETTRQVRGAAFKKLGTMSQEAIGKLAKEIMQEVAESIVEDALFGGLGFNDAKDLERFDGMQRRVIDFTAKAGDLIADIEAKYGVPKKASEAMGRLVSQVRSMRSGPRTRRVLLLFKDDIDAKDLDRLRQTLRDGKAGPVDIIHGTQKITEYFRDFFRNAL